jgi:CRP-like cAMP-binding protein
MPVHPHPTRPLLRQRADSYRNPQSHVRPWPTLAPQVQTQLAQQLARLLRSIREHETCHADSTD